MLKPIIWNPCFERAAGDKKSNILLSLRFLTLHVKSDLKSFHTFSHSIAYTPRKAPGGSHL